MTSLLHLYDNNMTDYNFELPKVLRPGEQGQYFSEMKQMLKKQFELY